MPCQPVGGTVSVCKHEIVYADLRDKILEGVYAPRDALGSERKLCAHYGVSRSTVRTAIARLKQEGLVHSRQGSGVYVNPPELYVTTDAAEEVPQHVHEEALDVRVLRSEVTADEEHAAAFGMSTYAKLVHTHALRTYKGFPQAIEDVFVPQSLVPHLDVQELSRATREQLEAACGLAVSHMHQRVRAIAADDEMAARLHVLAGTPLLQVDEYAFLPHGVLLRHVRRVTRDPELRFTVAC